MSGENAQYDTEEKTQLLEQYKLYVEMADRISERRVGTNKFFITIHALMITLLSLFGTGSYAVMILATLMGMLFSGAWFVILRSYRQLNGVKFYVIHSMERHLPCKPYKEEWRELRQGNTRIRYWSQSRLEAVLPVVFCILYLALLIYICGCAQQGIDVSITSPQIPLLP